MIRSMTGFSRIELYKEFGYFTCEMRSINHRYLEINISLPDVLRSYEMAIREVIREMISRGKIDCIIRYQNKNVSDVPLFSINQKMVKDLKSACQSIVESLNNPFFAHHINLIDLIKFPGILETPEIALDGLQEELLVLIKTTVKELILVREREGKELSQFFLKQVEKIQEELSKIRHLFPHIITELRARLIDRFKESELTYDENRLEQEMIFFINKLDITEELARLEAHIMEVKRTLDKGGAQGRRLDFLFQELNRESNTIASKSSNQTVTHSAVEIKVLIEQMREQIQNIE